MPSVTRRPSQARTRRRDTQQQVLDAVERLLADGESFTTLPVARIAEAAGIRRSTFYDYFPDKPTLIRELTASATEKLFARAYEFAADDDATLEDLVEVVAHHVSEYRRHAPLLQAAGEVRAYDADVARHWAAQVEAFAATLTQRITRDVAAGRAAPFIDPAGAATFISWGTERAIAMHVATHPPKADRAFIRGVAAASWGAMGRS